MLWFEDGVHAEFWAGDDFVEGLLTLELFQFSTRAAHTGGVRVYNPELRGNGEAGTMKRRMLQTGLLTICVLAIGAGAGAQEFRVTENPFQDEFAYRVPNDLHPNIEVDQVRWSNMSIAPKKGKAIVAGKANAVTVNLELENLSKKKAVILFIVLLEDERGRQIGRYETKPIKIGGQKSLTYTEKAKIDGEILQGTARLWIFFEVTR